MNKVYLSGQIFNEPQLVGRPEAEPHLVFALLMKHQSKQGMHRELYRISAWNNCAAFAAMHLKKGMRIALQGYLTQRPIPMGAKVFHATEVTMSEVFLPSATSEAGASQPPLQLEEAITG